MSLRGISPIRESHPSRIAAWIAIALLVVVVFAVGWPGVHGFWGRDDYFQLALARMIGSPWPLFAHDHFPVPHSVFRPLGFASMWLDTRLFGTEYAPHAVCDLALHAGAALALFGVLRRAFVSPFAAALAALAFALHPAASGTAQWWSARFDVLATLFVLLALQAALAYRARPSALALGAALLAAFAAMASKEIGLVAPAVLFLIWLRWAWREPRTRGRALRACAYALACAALFLVWRASVLGTATSGLLGGASLGAVLGAGLRIWLRDVGGYFSYAALLATWQCALLGLAAFGFVVAWVVSRRHPRAVFDANASARAAQARTARGDLVVCGLCLLLLPALLQAPIAMLNAAPLRADFSAVEAAMQSRLYYLGIAGAALLLGALLSSLRGDARHRFRGVGARAHRVRRRLAFRGAPVRSAIDADFRHRTCRRERRRCVAACRWPVPDFLPRRRASAGVGRFRVDGFDRQGARRARRCRALLDSRRHADLFPSAIRGGDGCGCRAVDAARSRWQGRAVVAGRRADDRVRRGAACARCAGDRDDAIPALAKRALRRCERRGRQRQHRREAAMTARVPEITA
jgi:hypothetical protein